MGFFFLQQQKILQVDPKALEVLSRVAMSDIAHLLRPGHLAQLRKISYFLKL